MQVLRRHQWYLTGQAIALALADTELPVEEREELARALHGQPKHEIRTGRPVFPVLSWASEAVERPRLATLTTPDWLLTPCAMWPLFSDYRRLEEFALNVSVTNDLAERVRLIDAKLKIATLLLPGSPDDHEVCGPGAGRGAEAGPASAGGVPPVHSAGLQQGVPRELLVMSSLAGEETMPCHAWPSN
jgi:hypothetical protein